MKKFIPTHTAWLALLFLLPFAGLSQGEACGSASLIVPDGTCYATSTIGAADNLTGEAGCATLGGANGHRDQWFQFTATDVQFDITINNIATPGTVEVLLFSGSCAGLTLEFSSCGTPNFTDVFVGLIPGNPYWVCVSTPQGGTGDGTFDVCIDNSSAATAPANDDCSGAIAVPTDGSCTPGTNIGANDSWTAEVGCATAGPNGQHLDVWYSFVATGGVFDITATDFTVGGDLEIILASPGITPCVSAFTIVDSWCGPSPLVGNYAGLIPGNTYYYTVSSSSNQVGNFETCVTNSNIVNDDCAGAIPITVGTAGICVEVEGTNAGATATGGVPAPGCANYSGGDVWYSITVPASGNVTFGVDFAAANSLTDMGMEIYYGPCGSLTSIACDDDGGTGLMPDIQGSGLTPGATVYIRLWDYGNANIGAFDLCISEPAPSLSNQDCVSALPICSSANFGGSSNGSGSVVDLVAANDDCLFGENQTSWLYLEISSPGDFMFTLTPTNGTDDYDFALWHYPGGVGQVCPPAAGDVDRCSYGAGAGFGGSYDTGMDDGTITGFGNPGDQSESAAGDNWVDELPVVAGDAIMLLIDNFSSTTSPYTIDFTGNAGLDCTILPTEFMTFYATPENDDNLIKWVTLAEINNSYFTIQHSVDGEVRETIDNVQGAGNSHEKRTYGILHKNVQKRVNYYRLYQTDYDGTESDFKVVSINSAVTGKNVVLTTNLVGQEVDENYSGFVIDVFEDGTSVKRIQP